MKQVHFQAHQFVFPEGRQTFPFGLAKVDHKPDMRAGTAGRCQYADSARLDETELELRGSRTLSDVAVPCIGLLGDVPAAVNPQTGS